MSLYLDHKQAKALDCQTCDVGLQKLRNCGGRFSPALIRVNDEIHRECPRAITLGHFEARTAVEMYLDCRENKCVISQMSSYQNARIFLCKSLSGASCNLPIVSHGLRDYSLGTIPARICNGTINHFDDIIINWSLCLYFARCAIDESS